MRNQTFSSGWCAKFGSPGPKLIAGIPALAKRATSVQPNFGATFFPIFETNSFINGFDSPVGAAFAASTNWKLKTLFKDFAVGSIY